LCASASSTSTSASIRPLGAEVPVRIIDVDDASLAALGQWPWPRTLLADMVNTLRDAGAAVIAFDMLFPEPDRTNPLQRH
jgi:adenylate cyclase